MDKRKPFWVIQRVDESVETGKEYKIIFTNQAKVIHTDVDAAIVEAERLAGENPGVEFVLMKSTVSFITKKPDVERILHDAK